MPRASRAGAPCANSAAFVASNIPERARIRATIPLGQTPRECRAEQTCVIMRQGDQFLMKIIRDCGRKCKKILPVDPPGGVDFGLEGAVYVVLRAAPFQRGLLKQANPSRF